jgi:hypothetical protein
MWWVAFPCVRDLRSVAYPNVSARGTVTVICCLAPEAVSMLSMRPLI